MLAALQDLLQLHPTPYTLVRLVAWTSALALAVALNRRQGIAALRTLGLAAVCIPLSIVGARVLDAVEYAATYPSLSEALGRNGSSIYGGLGLVFLAVWGYAAWLRVPALRLLDAASPGIALGESVSRIGCFLGSCCYGVPWNGPWAVTFPRDSFAFSDQVARGLLSPTADHSLAVHPVQLYSAILALGMCVWLARAFLARRVDGEVFFRFLVGYGVLRLAMAPLRIEALDSMTVFSGAFVVVGTLGLMRARMRSRVGSEAPARRPVVG